MFPSDPDLTVTDALVLCLDENIGINSKITYRRGFQLDKV